MQLLDPPRLGPVTSSPVTEYLESLHAALAAVGDGAVATYIPELARADPRHFGIAIATTDGECFTAGDAEIGFTIQSISKPFVYGLALADNGRQGVLDRVGVEPSGNPFNAIVLDETTNRPYNPMVNAGAIATTALVAGVTAGDRASRIVAALGCYAGHDLEVDEAVFESERSTGDRNRAIAYLMRSFGILEGDAETVLDAYFRQCSVRVTGADLAVMAATLANGGINPRTGIRALASDHVESVLAVMSTCGMYDYAGEWIFGVGLPAKSGVAGGVIAVLPGHVGIGVYSPLLDARGNSVRGIRACERISDDFGLHMLHPRSPLRMVVRRTARGDSVRSNRVRTADADRRLETEGRAVAIHELQGDLFFASMERAYRSIVEDTDETRYVIIDFRRVTSVDQPATDLLDSLGRVLMAAGRILVLAHVDGIAPDVAPAAERFVDADAALEWCEERLLGAEHDLDHLAVLSLNALEIFEGLDPIEASAVGQAITVRTYEAGTVVFSEGDAADAVCFVLAGSVSVQLRLPEASRRHRLASFGAGVAFGEMAMLDDGARSADVVAEELTVVGVLTTESFERLGASHPRLVATVYRNLARDVARRLRHANAQIRALDA